MKEIKNTVSDAQKAAQKRYDQKTKTVSIKYTPADMEDYERLKRYIDETGKSTNGFIKDLINDFFEHNVLSFFVLSACGTCALKTSCLYIAPSLCGMLWLCFNCYPFILQAANC